MSYRDIIALSGDFYNVFGKDGVEISQCGDSLLSEATMKMNFLSAFGEMDAGSGDKMDEIGIGHFFGGEMKEKGM